MIHRRAAFEPAATTPATGGGHALAQPAPRRLDEQLQLLLRVDAVSD